MRLKGGSDSVPDFLENSSFSKTDENSFEGNELGPKKKFSFEDIDHRIVPVLRRSVQEKDTPITLNSQENTEFDKITVDIQPTTTDDLENTQLCIKLSESGTLEIQITSPVDDAAEHLAQVCINPISSDTTLVKTKIESLGKKILKENPIDTNSSIDEGHFVDEIPSNIQRAVDDIVQEVEFTQRFIKETLEDQRESCLPYSDEFKFVTESNSNVSVTQSPDETDNENPQTSDSEKLSKSSSEFVILPQHDENTCLNSCDLEDCPFKTSTIIYSANDNPEIPFRTQSYVISLPPSNLCLLLIKGM